MMDGFSPKIFDTISDVIIITNSRYEIVELNQRGREIFGDHDFKKDKVKCHDLICKNKIPRENCPIHCQLNADSAPVKNVLFEYEDYSFRVNAGTLPSIDNETRYIEVLNDVSDLIRAQKKQQEITEQYQALNKKHHASLEELENINLLIQGEKERYQQLFINMNSAFALHEIIVDSEGIPCNYRFLDCNQLFEKYTGLKRP